jgi:hypothetical protein
MAFDTLMGRLRTAVAKASAQGREMQQMLEASFRQLNTDFGFTFQLAPAPSLEPTLQDLQVLERNYGRYLGLGQAWRLASPGFAEQFRRMLLSKLRVVFESAASELELWSKSATAQVDAQLRERRRSFERRREAMERVQSAAGELEQRIAEVQTQDDALNDVQQRVQAQADRALAATRNLLAAA